MPCGLHRKADYMDINYEQIGSKIRNYRELKGLSQEELADILDVSWRFVNYLEHGERKVNVGVLVALANALSITPNDLLADYLTTSEETQISDIFSSCNSTEKAILMDMLKHMKSLLSKHGI